MKKLKLVGILAAVVLIGGVISIPLINNYTAYKVEWKWDAVFRSNPN